MFSSLKNVLVSDESHGNRIERNIISRSTNGYAIRAYRLTGLDNVFLDNVFYGFTKLQYADPGYSVVKDGGSNRFPLDPEFNGTGCGTFKPLDAIAQAYGRFAP
jgi:hypothetical protein